MAAGDLTLNIGHITGLGGFRPDADDVSPQGRPGTHSMLVDALGFRVFKYIRAIAAGTKGQVMQSTGDTTTPFTAIANQTGTFTTKAVTTGLTANDQQGKVAWVQDDAGAAGAAPEGEMTVIASNTITDLIFEPELPLSAALAANDDLQLVATYQAEVGTAGCLAAYIQGVVVANGGITAGRYGWVQQSGLVVANVTPAAIVVGAVLEAGSTGVMVASTTAAGDQDEWIAVAYSTIASDQVAAKILAKLTFLNATTTNLP